MNDRYERNINYLRLSVTDRCDLRCLYCRGSECHPDMKTYEMTREEIRRIVAVSEHLGIKKVRLTGGEPLMREDIIEICKDLSSIDGIDELCITTNGSRLSKYAVGLKESGIKKINISLDTVDPSDYASITGGSLKAVLKGVDACYSAGYERLSLNAVIMRSYTYTENIRNLIEFSKSNPIDLRFIELMPMTEIEEIFKKEFMGYKDVLRSIDTDDCIGNIGTSVVYRLKGSQSTVGFIPALSEPFCSTCSRIRVTSDGKLKPCLHSKEEYDLLGYRDEKQLEDRMRELIFNKPRSHSLSYDSSTGSQRPMSRIGG